MPGNREWIQMTLAHREPEAVPYNFSFSPPARERLESHYGGSPIERLLDFPIRMTGLKTIKPLYASPEEFGETARDEYGVVWTTNEIDRGSLQGPCLPEPDLSRYSFPDATAEYRFTDIGTWCNDNKENYTTIWVGDLWERATFMRGMENILIDLSLHPTFVNDLLRGIADYILETMQILFDKCQFDAIAVSDDYGTQKAMIMSPEYWRKFVRSLLAEIYALAKEHDRKVFHHSCGSICLLPQNAVGF